MPVRKLTTYPKIIAALPALLFLLALSAPATAATLDCRHQLALAVADAELTEYTGFGELTEQALWPVLAARAALPLADARACLAVDGSVQGGAADYDGFDQLGAAHQTTSDQQLWRLDLTGSYALDDRFALAVTGSAERFLREIRPAGAVGGLNEDYAWLWLGAGGDWRMCRACPNVLIARVRWSLLVDGSSDVDLGSFGSVDISLEDATRTRYEFELQRRDAGAAWPALALYWEQRDFARSERFPITGGSLTGNAYQPAFDVDELGLALRWNLQR